MSFDKEQFLLDRILQLTQRGAELTAQRDAALAELAALQKRLADAPTSFVCAGGQTLFHFPENTGAFGKYALVRLEEDA